MHLAPAGRHVYSIPIALYPKAPVALNPDLSGRGDMCHLSESQIARMITPISSGGLASKIAH